MEETHLLAVVSRAKAISRQQGLAIKDETLGYLCTCADLDGSWWKRLDKSPTAGAEGAPSGARPWAACAQAPVPRSS